MTKAPRTMPDVVEATFWVLAIAAPFAVFCVWPLDRDAGWAISLHPREATRCFPFHMAVCIWLALLLPQFYAPELSRLQRWRLTAAAAFAISVLLLTTAFLYVADIRAAWGYPRYDYIDFVVGAFVVALVLTPPVILTRVYMKGLSIAPINPDDLTLDDLRMLRRHGRFRAAEVGGITLRDIELARRAARADVEAQQRIAEKELELEQLRSRAEAERLAREL